MFEKVQEDKMMIDWKIEPQIGVGPLKFGMSPEEVAAILGPTEHTDKIANNFVGLPELQKRYKNDVAEYRIFGDVTTMKPTVTYRSGKMVNAAFDKIHNTLSLNGMNLFKTSRSKVIEKLMELNKNVISTNNEYTLYFMDTGINLANTMFARKESLIAVWRTEVYDYLYNDPDYLYIKRG
jgi:hypothetical protein